MNYVSAPGPVVYVLLTALVIFALGPIVLFFFNALKTQSELATDPLGLPQTWQWGNFATAWQQANMGAGLWNSVVIVGGTVILTCIIAGCAAYALARLEIKGQSAFITYLLVSSSLPTQMFLVPLFYMWTQAGLYDTHIGLILIYCGLFSPFATLLLRSFMLTLPREFEEAARMDGANELTVLMRIVLPNVLPGFLTIALVTGLASYNEFLFAVTFIQDSSLLPISTTFYSFQQGYTQDFTLISAAGVIMIAPMLILFLILQRRFIDGLSSSGLGGA
jgi:raffinose/stachyose/melibiose transport system permease protein